MDSVSYLNPAQLHSNPAFTQAVHIPAGHDLIVISGQTAPATLWQKTSMIRLAKPSATHARVLGTLMPILNTSFGGQS
jgi:hypothetical protein